MNQTTKKKYVMIHKQHIKELEKKKKKKYIYIYIIFSMISTFKLPLT